MIKLMYLRVILDMLCSLVQTL